MQPVESRMNQCVDAGKIDIQHMPPICRSDRLCRSALQEPVRKDKSVKLRRRLFHRRAQSVVITEIGLDRTGFFRIVADRRDMTVCFAQPGMDGVADTAANTSQQGLVPVGAMRKIETYHCG